MFKPILLASLLALISPVAHANVPGDQLLLLVRAELSDYVQDVDAADLSRHQLGAIYSIMHSGKSHNDKAGSIRSIVGGRHTLRSLFWK